MSDLSLPSCVRTPSFGAIRSPLANAQPQIALPPPPLTWAGLGAPGPTGHSLSGRLYSAHCPGPWIYIWLAPPPPACPKKLLESWKRFRRAPWLRERKKSQRPPPNHPGSRPCACGRSPSPWVLLPPRPTRLRGLSFCTSKTLGAKAFLGFRGAGRVKQGLDYRVN